MDIIKLLFNKVARSSILNAVFSPRCLICSSALDIEKVYLCRQCEDLLPIFTKQTENACQICSLPIVKELTYCIHCQNQELKYIDKTYCGYIYDFPIDKLIVNLKHQPNINLAKNLVTKIFAELNINISETPAKIRAIVPMPLHRQRIKYRGYNQSIQIALALSKLTNIPLDLKIAERVVNTQSTQGLTREQRFRKIKNAFAVNKKLTGDNYLLVDDVMTTGASINELAKSLKEQGAEKCFVFTLARAINL